MGRVILCVRIFGIVCAAMLVAAGLGCGGRVSGQGGGKEPSEARPAGKVVMQKCVTDKAGFALYLPKGWKASEGTCGGYRMLFVTDPSDSYGASMFVGTSPAAPGDVVGLAKIFVSRIGQAFPDLRVRNTWMSHDASRVVVDGAFTMPKGARREFRSWVSGRGAEFSYLVIEAPEGQLEAMRPQLLSILTSVRVTKAAPGGVTEMAKVPLVEHRLKDGSAKVSVPADWTFTDLGKGSFIAGDPTGQYGFLVAGVGFLTGKGGVVAPGVPLSPYRVPSDAWRFVTGLQGLATNMQFLSVTPRPEVAQQLVIPGRISVAHAEEFVYTYTNKQGRAAKGYTFGVTSAPDLGFNWGLWHITVVGPADQFDGYAANLSRMIQSYAGNEEYAREYIRRGNERLRQMERETAAKIAANGAAIREMMQAAYDERQKSHEYIDYQRTQYIRGESDWISEVEGGAVYHTDSWGTKNTWTGEYYEAKNGAPFDYVNFEGKNPKHNEMMQPVDSRRVWEQNVYGK